MSHRSLATCLVLALFGAGCGTARTSAPAFSTLYPGGDAVPVRFAASYSCFVPAARRSGESTDAAVTQFESWLASQQTGFTRWQAEGSSGAGRPPRRGWIYRVSVAEGVRIDAASLRRAFGEAFGADEPFYVFE